MKRGEGDTARKRRTVKESSSGNAFADLGFPHPEIELFKARLMLQICRLIKARRLTQAEAGKILGIKPPNVSRLMRGSSGTYSVDRLIEFLTALGQDVEVVIKPTRKRQGQMSVIVAA